MMKKLCKKTFHFDIKRRILWRISILRRRLRHLWKHFYACWVNHRPSSSPEKEYRQLMGPTESTTSRLVNAAASINACAPLPPPPRVLEDHGDDLQVISTVRILRADSASDLVSLKISLFGDPQTGKSSFLAKYAGVGKEFNEGRMNHVDKTLCVEGATISYSIWEVGGDEFYSLDHIPSACQDSVAMLFMFDLTSRMTLNSVIKWYQAARKWNQAAIPVLVGTKFDEFVQLPIDLQWTVASQARAYAKALNATLFFSSATYNINVNKIFKFITAKLFDLQWNVERNLNVGEPIIDY